MQTIAILSTNKDPLLGHLIKKIYKIKNLNFIIIFAKISLQNSNKNLKIFKDRTGDYFKTKKEISAIDIKKFNFKSHNSVRFKKFILKNKIKYLFNSSTPGKIEKKILEAVKGVINIHPGILPKYRGCTNVEWALNNEDPIGITAHLMNEKYDSGPIIKKKIIKFKKKNINEYKDIRILTYLEQIELAKCVFKLIVKNNIKLKKHKVKKNSFYPIIPNKILINVKKNIKNKSLIFNRKNLL